MEGKYYYVYIATNLRHTVLYTGVTNSIFERSFQHKNKINKKSFTARYNVEKVVYYETYTDVHRAIAREKQIKGGSRAKKIILINKLNPEWKDLVEESFK
jgi:putative endonuclease